MAFFLNCDAFSSPNSLAIFLSNSFSPLPQVSCGSGTRLRYSQRGRQRKGYLASLPFMPMARSSLPRLRIHSLSISNSIQFSISSYPARLQAMRQREQPANIQSAPNPVSTILALVPALARCRAAAMLKSMWVLLGQMLCISCTFIFSRSSRFLFSRIRLNLRPGLNDCSQPKEILPAQRSGASSRKARFTRSISSYFGSVRSSSRAISVESMPPENRTATLAAGYLQLYLQIPLMQRVSSRTLSTNSFFTFAITLSSLSASFSRPIFLRSNWWIGCCRQKAQPLRRWIEIMELAGISNICLDLLDSHYAQYLAFQFQSFYSSAFGFQPLGYSLAWKCSKGLLVSIMWFSLMPNSRLRLPKQSFRMNIWSPSIRIMAQSPLICPITSNIFSSDPLQSIRVWCSHFESFSQFSSSMGGRLPVSHIYPLNKKQEPGVSQTQLWAPRRWRIDCTASALPLSMTTGSFGVSVWQLVLQVSIWWATSSLGPRFAR